MTFSDFDMLLEASRGGDARDLPWTETRRKQARADLVQFMAEDWQWLESQWRSRARGWKLLFAGLAHPSQTYAHLLPILVDMILAPDMELALEAALALERLVDKLRILRPHPMDYSTALPDRLDDLMADPASPGRLLERLKRRLEQSYTF